MPSLPARVLVVGSSNIDYVMRLPALPRVGETVTGGRFQQTFGGKGANQAVAAARAGAQTAFITAVGRDPTTEAMLRGFEADGLPRRHVVELPDRPTGVALIMVDHAGHNYLTVAAGTNHELRPEHLDQRAAAFDDAGVVVLQMELADPTTEHALSLAAAHQKPVVFNYAPAQNPTVAVDARMTYLVVNEVEAQTLTGRPVTDPASAEAAARVLADRGPRAVVVTLGQQGSVAVEADRCLHVPAPRVEAVDSTAAGDTFCGVLAAFLAEGASTESGLRYATAAAALSVQTLGAQPSIPRRADVVNG